MSDLWLTLARDAFSESTSFFDAGVRSEIEQDLRQFQGQHPPGSKYGSDTYRTRSKFFRPKTRGAIRKNEATAASAFFSNADVVSLEPEDDQDKIQVASAAVWQEVMNYRLDKTLPWFTTLIGAYQDAQAVGICASYQAWQYDEKSGIDRPICRLLATENYRFSPHAEWQNPVTGSPYWIELIPMLVKDVKARMMTADEKTGQPKWNPLTDAEIVAAALKYADTLKLQRNQGRADAQGRASAITAFSLVWVHRNFIEYNGRDYVYYTLGDQHLLSQPVEVEERYHHGERPYVVGNCVIETHKLYPSGIARMSRDVQAELNENANQRMDNVKFALNKRYFAKRGRQIDLRSLTRNVPGSVTMLEDPELDVKVVETQDVTKSAYEEQDRLNLDFDDLVGTFSQASVGSNRKLAETVGGMEMLTADASLVTAYTLKTFAETWVKPVLRQLLLLEQHYETDEKMFALAGKKAQQAQRIGDDVVIDDKLLMQELTVRVNVGIGATTPQSKLSNFLFALKSLREMLLDDVLQRAGADVREIATEIFSKLGYDGPGRFFDWGQEDPRIQELQQRIAELEDELKQKEDPELTAAKIKKTLAEADKIAAGKTKEGVEAMFGAMQAAEVVAAVPAVAPVADQIMRAAGYIAPTPPGIDPGFAPGEQGPLADGAMPLVPAAPMPAEGMDRELPGAVNPSTNPMTPTPTAAPKSPFTGRNAGIETMRSDTQGPDE
ncbi:MAG TPA: hypothetical protein PLL30_17035 [Candidatus Krumholzibacteria bacterium]|nr:hypothetical protein [Candidatus Krumholzibacteria bacterium]HPD73480.1 hypothetical protein [Candidatus Krumholzibacteria bacterium]HRY42203.1 hypothetical protein [Candidatus Krumholzibacteria bacterium]